MRLNPFSGAFGKRQAATSTDESRDDEDDLVLTGDEPEPTNDPMTALHDIKRFGFAKRPDGTVILRSDVQGIADEEAGVQAPSALASDMLPDPSATSVDGQQAGLDRPEPDEPVSRLVKRLGASSFARDIAPQSEPRPEQARSSDALVKKSPAPNSEEQPAASPLRRTAHIERLKAEMGDDAANADLPPVQATTEPESGWTAKPKHPDSGPASPSQPPARGAFGRAAAVDTAHDIGIVEPESTAVVNEALASAPAPGGDPDIDDVEDDLDDVAVTIGRVVSIRGSVIWGALFDDIDGQAAKAARMGALVSMNGPDSRVFGIVNSLEREQQAGTGQVERTVFEIQVLGEIADNKAGFQRGVSSYPPLDAPITTVTRRDIGTIYARPSTSNVHIGQLRHNPKIPAFVLTDSLLGKHFAVLGTTGAGKSCAVTVILQSILNEHPLGHIVLLDPHNEYGHAFGEHAELLNPANLQLPYWLLNYEEIEHILLGDGAYENRDAQTAILKDAIVHAKRAFAGEGDLDSQITVDTPVPYRLSDLVSKLKDGMGMLNNAAGSSRYLNLINRIESLRADKRYSFMFSSLTVRDNMEQILAQLLRIPTKGKPLTIIDISGLPSEVVDVVVSVLFRLTFELAVWSERGKAPPVLLVCEEAHRYVPEEVGVGFAPTRRVISRIAKEGRKYGVTLCLVSQRPAELAINSLAQCNTVFALRLSNEHDQAFVARTLSENSRWLVDSLPSLNTQEAVVVGDGVTVPIHIRFNDLHPNHRPASHDPSFAKSWRYEADDAFLHQAIDRWRSQAR